MGAWGTGSFDNDGAGDWVCEFAEQGVAVVVSALELVANFPEEEYLERDEAEAAIAAVEVVASARDDDVSRLSNSALEAFSKYRRALTDLKLLELSRRALERVLRQSEVKELWEETAKTSDCELWLQGMDHLLSRLG